LGSHQQLQRNHIQPPSADFSACSLSPAKCHSDATREIGIDPRPRAGEYRLSDFDMNARQLIPGFRFQEGKLIVSTEEDVRVIHAWPYLRAIRRVAPRTGWKPWVPFTPSFRLLRRAAPTNGSEPDDQDAFRDVKSRALDPALEKLSAFASFRCSVPAAIAEAVEPFKSNHWTLLSVCERQERTKDLLTQTPALGFALVHNYLFRWVDDGHLDLAARLATKKQREVARYLGFPSSHAWVKILSKIPPDIVSLRGLLALREASIGSIRHITEELLCHVPRINAAVLALTTDLQLRDLVSPRLLAETAESPDETTTSPTAQALTDILALRKRMGICEPLRPFQSGEVVRRKQQETVAQYDRFIRDQENTPLPDPPLPGTADVVPLVLSSQLAEEGRVQHNCVHSYAERVRAGECYIYRVLAPERATLSIVKGEDGCWEIEQLYLSCNRPVASHTWQRVEAWLAMYSVSA